MHDACVTPQDVDPVATAPNHGPSQPLQASQMETVQNLNHQQASQIEAVQNLNDHQKQQCSVGGVAEGADTMLKEEYAGNQAIIVGEDESPNTPTMSYLTSIISSTPPPPIANPAHGNRAPGNHGNRAPGNHGNQPRLDIRAPSPKNIHEMDTLTTELSQLQAAREEAAKQQYIYIYNQDSNLVPYSLENIEQSQILSHLSELVGVPKIPVSEVDGCLQNAVVPPSNTNATSHKRPVEMILGGNVNDTKIPKVNSHSSRVPVVIKPTVNTSNQRGFRTPQAPQPLPNKQPLEILLTDYVRTVNPGEVKVLEISEVKAEEKSVAPIKTYKCSYCGYTSVKESIVVRHIRCHGPQYSCLICDDFETGKEAGIVSHMKNEHAENKPYKCPDCSFKTTSQNLLEKHRTKALCGLYNCALCTQQCSTKQQLTRHALSKHPRDPSAVSDIIIPNYKCRTCHYETESRDLYQTHICSPLSCTITGSCHTRHPRSIPKHKHLARKPPNITPTPYRCHTCQLYSYSAEGLAQHLLTHQNDPAYTCLMANIEEGKQFMWTRQQEERNGDVAVYRCSECDHVTSSISELTVHIGTHPSGIFKL